MTAASASPPATPRTALLVGLTAMLSLAVAMGVGRFAFTPLYPLMAQDGLLTGQGGALLAASNYFGYLVGALVAARLSLQPSRLMAYALILTVVVTAAMGWTANLTAWTLLRFMAGVLSAWAFVATSAWGLGWLAALERPQLAGAVYAGVGLGIASVGVFCLVAAKPGVLSSGLWVNVAALTGAVVLLPLLVLLRLPAPPIRASTVHAASPALHGSGHDTSIPGLSTPAEPPPATSTTRRSSSIGTGFIISYSLYGLGYILPATYLPALARNLIDDPQMFGLAWPVFGIAAAFSTVFAASALKRMDRLKIWAGCHLLMAAGVLLPLIWASLVGIAVAASLVGGTFMVITTVAMQEARTWTTDKITTVMGLMTAGFALGQLLGPVVSAVIGYFASDFDTALDYAMVLAAAGLLGSGAYLWRQALRRAI